MFKFRRAAAKGQRPQATDGTGVAVRHRMGGAGQHHADLWPHHMGNPMFGFAQIKHAHAVFAAGGAHGVDEGLAFNVCAVIAPGR